MSDHENPVPPQPYVQQQPYGQPQQPYGQPPYAYGQTYVAPPRGQSITSFVLGLVSVFFGFVLVAPVLGLIFGILGLRREPAGKGFALTGLILSGVMLIGWVILGLFISWAIVGVAATVGTAGTVGTLTGS